MKKFIATLLAVALVAVACCVFASAEDVNLTQGKTYTAVGIFTEKTETQPDYPDEGGVTLTDGVKAPAEVKYNDALWVGFNKNVSAVAEIVVDLTASSKVSKFSIETLNDTTVGIEAPTEVEFFYSADGETWTSAGKGTESGEGNVSEFALSLDSAVDANYVKVSATCSGPWLFISEFEAFGTAGSGGTDESEAVSEAESETVSAAESETASSAAPVESSAAASSNASSTPSTSDAGIVAVVVLAVVAVIGAAVVVKKRA